MLPFCVDYITAQQIGMAVSVLSDWVGGEYIGYDNGYAHVLFSELNWIVPQGSSRDLYLVADVSTFDDIGLYTTGQTIEPVILEQFAPGENSVKAHGFISNTAADAQVLTTNSQNLYAQYSGAYAATATMYRAKLTIDWTFDTPNGASWTDWAKLVAKYIIKNMANSGGYAANLQWMDVDLATNIQQNLGFNQPQTLTIFKDSLMTTPLATTQFLPTQQFGRTRFSDWAFTDVSISSGSSKTFWVILDIFYAQTSDVLSVGIAKDFVHWSDGPSNLITAMGYDLPLTYKTLSF